MRGKTKKLPGIIFLLSNEIVQLKCHNFHICTTVLLLSSTKTILTCDQWDQIWRIWWFLVFGKKCTCLLFNKVNFILCVVKIFIIVNNVIKLLMLFLLNERQITKRQVLKLSILQQMLPGYILTVTQRKNGFIHSLSTYHSNWCVLHSRLARFILYYIFLLIWNATTFCVKRTSVNAVLVVTDFLSGTKKHTIFNEQTTWPSGHTACYSRVLFKFI